MLTYVLGIDIGGTKIASALMTRSGEVIESHVVPSDATEKEKMYAQVVRGIKELLDKTGTTTADLFAIGVGVAGKVDNRNGVAVYQNNLPWRNFPLADRLRETFSVDNVVVENDVVMATFAEWEQVREHDEETFVYITVSTGISCQTIHRGEVVRGGGFAGEMGLFPVLKAQSSLKRLEKVAAGPALQQAAAKTWDLPTIHPKDVFEKYADGDEDAVQLIDEVAEGIAHGLYAIICLVDPHKIVVGGGVFNHQPILLELVKKSLEKYLIEEQMDVLNRFSLSVLKGDAGVVGAGLQAKKHIETVIR